MNVKTLQRSRTHQLLPYALLLAVMLIFHLCVRYAPGDEALYGAVMQDWTDWSGLWAYMVYHYYHWSGRMLTETLFVVFSMLPPLAWRLLNPLVIVLIARMLAYVTRADENGSDWLVCVLVFLYQWAYMSDAGWIVTSIAYVWPMAFGLVGLLGLWRTMRGQTTPLPGWIGCSVCLLFASNMEQPALVLFVLMAACIIWLLAQRRKIPAGLWVQFALIAAALVFIFLCPGNAMRTEEDIFSFYVNYPMLSVVKKAEIGISGVIAANVYGRDSIFYLFAVLSALALWEKRAPLVARLLGLVPCVAMLPFSMFRYQMKSVFPAITFFTEAYSASGYLTLANCGSPLSYLPMLMGYGILALCLLNVFGAFGFSSVTAMVWGLVALGGMSQAAMGFTPSVGVSGTRTGILFSFCIIAACAVLWRGLDEPPLRLRGTRLALGAVLLVLCGIQVYYLWQMC